MHLTAFQDDQTPAVGPPDRPTGRHKTWPARHKTQRGRQAAANYSVGLLGVGLLQPCCLIRQVPFQIINFNNSWLRLFSQDLIFKTFACGARVETLFFAIKLQQKRVQKWAARRNRGRHCTGTVAGATANTEGSGKGAQRMLFDTEKALTHKLPPSARRW
jgi:hypothetical protein